MPKAARPESHESNQILARLPAADYARILRQLRPIPLQFKVVLTEPDALVSHATFPTRGVLSAIVVMQNGSAIEAANIGREGFMGSTIVFAARTSPYRVIVQVEGEGLQMEIARFEAEIDRQGALYELTMLYNAALLSQVSQSVACNGLHSTYQRCCRWLLMAHERVHSDQMPLTHEFLAIMLGVRRAGVTEILKSLKVEGLIRSTRGSVTILDHTGLEAACCECYRAVSDEYKRLFARLPVLR